VRQAINYAIDKENLVQVVLQGNGIPAYGFLSPSMKGYTPDIEQSGYHYEPDQAARLFAEAGYTPGDGGILQKDGQPLQFTLLTDNGQLPLNSAEVLQQQLKAVGVDVFIEQGEVAAVINRFYSGDFEAVIESYVSADARLIAAVYSPGLNILRLPAGSDPELLAMLDQAGNTVDLAAYYRLMNEIDAHGVQMAYFAPFFIDQYYIAFTNRVQGAVFTPNNPTIPMLWDAWFVSP